MGKRSEPMTPPNQDSYIKKAVELADGWKHEGGNCLLIPFDTGLWAYPDLEQCHLDALAAQLVRQVDTTDFVVQIYSTETEINDTFGLMLINRAGPDRTMNTIKAIVDSGVLG